LVHVGADWPPVVEPIEPIEPVELVGLAAVPVEPVVEVAVVVPVGAVLWLGDGVAEDVQPLSRTVAAAASTVPVMAVVIGVADLVFVCLRMVVRSSPGATGADPRLCR
jgi:hypothetical protein